MEGEVLTRVGAVSGNKDGVETAKVILQIYFALKA